jgi:ABC-type nitrate/sulfonate/bicarbonate transport system substrate-binding protein
MMNMGIREITDRRIVWILILSFLSFSGSVSKHAHAQLTKLNVASSGISPTQIVPYLAQEAGIFAKNGLEVSVVRTRADVAVMSMLAGDTALIDVAGPIVIRSGLKGVDNVFIAAGAVTFNYWLMAAKAINTPQDLRGKIIGVAGLTGSTMVATRYAVTKLGLNPDKDIKNNSNRRYTGPLDRAADRTNSSNSAKSPNESGGAKGRL